MSNSNNLILVLNCGSSSVKFSVIDPKTEKDVLSGLAEKLNLQDASVTFKFDGHKETRFLTTNDHTGALESILEKLKALGLFEKVTAIGHRLVHGGEAFKASVEINDEVLKTVEACSNLAPLHNPANILGVRAAQKAFPSLKNVGVFDTSFHQTMPEHAYLYAVPMKLYRENHVRRYGFHGTSYRFVAKEAAKMLNKDENNFALVVAHLGNGASVASILNGKCMDTSMGLTPLEGLVMGTRSGDIDPGLFSYLNQELKMDISAINNLLNKESGLLGLSELSNDCREVEEAAENGNRNAQLALEVFAYRLAKYIAGYVVPLGRLDALVFTGGIGENSASMRARVINHLSFLGLKLDENANNETCRGKAGVITSSTAPLALVVNTNEELMIAQDTVSVLNIAI
ncbi:acetate kinase [Neisseria sp. Ec49-e6-T10]|uniref:acetate kinase n=1 Tax=Neisseria sp. Ec49-e6-T10 TaxID=3140744 RepID=UPI003EBF4F7C